MKKTNPFLLLIIAFSFNAFAKDPVNPIFLVEKALAAMGGKAKLENLKSAKITGIGHTYFLEQSERPQGPWIVNYEEIEELKDYSNERLLFTKRTKNAQQPEWQGSTLVYADQVLGMKKDDGTVIAGSKSMLDQTANELQNSPEQFLLTALRSEDLKTTTDTILQQVPHHSISFSFYGNKTTVFLNSHTGLPTMIRTLKGFPQNMMWSIWGKVKVECYYSFWQVTSENILFPFQYNEFRNDQPFREFTVTGLDLNQEFDDSDFKIPEEVKKAFLAQPKRDLSQLPLGLPGKEIIEPAPGILLIQGYWNITIVEQEEQVVLLEAPISMSYTAQAIEKVKRLFPGKKLSKAISTSDAWPHIGGIPACINNGLEIYSLKVNKPILERLAIAAKTSKKLIFKEAKSGTVVGKGKNRMVLYPIEGESGERMMLAYFPEHRLLYTSDLVQLNRDGSIFQPTYILEVLEAVKRNQLDVENVFAMHTGIIPFEKLQQVVEIPVKV